MPTRAFSSFLSLLFFLPGVQPHSLNAASTIFGSSGWSGIFMPLPTSSSMILQTLQPGVPLVSLAMTCHGAWSVSVRSSMSL